MSAAAEHSDTHKRCTECQEWLPFDSFTPQKMGVAGRTSQCRPCRSWLTRQRRYGVTREWFEETLGLQQGRCAICLSPFVDAPHIDHDHTDGVGRGLLCLACNLLLGYAADDPEVLQNAIDYLGGNEMLSAVQYFGGKGGQLKDLLPLIPHTAGYVEPFGGGASVLMNRPPSSLEVYNDLNQNTVNFFRVMQTPDLFEDLEHRLDWTLWSKEEFRRAVDLLKIDETPTVERAWAFYVVQNQGISGTHAKSVGNWSRSKANNMVCDKWKRLKERLEPVHRRFMGVQIDSQDGLDCMEYWDAPDVTHYVDPPYVLETRPGSGKQYEVELENNAHEAMIEVLLQLKGPVVLSGYDHPIYTPLTECGWDLHQYHARASTKVAHGAEGEGKPPRVECVWRNPQAMSYVRQMRLL